MRTIESREQALAQVQADLESRSAAVAEQERLAEAAGKAAADEAERVRRAERRARSPGAGAVRSPVEVQQPKKSEPAPAEKGFLAGLDAMASASSQRRARRKQP